MSNPTNIRHPTTTVLEIAFNLGTMDVIENQNGDMSKLLLAKLTGYPSWKQLYKKDPALWKRIYKTYLNGKDKIKDE